MKASTVYLITPLAKNFPIDPQADYIGIDQGYQLILQKHLVCTKAIGDFDSASSADFPLPQQSLVFPVEKDETDSQLAMEYAVDAGYEKIILWGGLSGRLDHTLANLLAAGWSYPQVILQDESHKVITLLEGEHILQEPYRHVSFFALEDSMITLENFKYEAQNRLLSRKDIYAVSNAFEKGKQAKITLQWGRVLCILSNEV